MFKNSVFLWKLSPHTSYIILKNFMFKPQLLYKKQSQMKHLFKIKPWTTRPFKNISKIRQKRLGKKSKFACRKINYSVFFVTKAWTRFLETYPAYLRNKTISSHQRKIDQTTPLASIQKGKRWSVNRMDCENGSSSQILWTKCPKLANFVCFSKSPYELDKQIFQNLNSRLQKNLYKLKKLEVVLKKTQSFSAFFNLSQFYFPLIE